MTHLKPLCVLGRLRGRQHLHKAVAAKLDAVAKVVGARQMPVQRRGIELGQHVDLADAAVDAVAHGHVDEPVGATDRHRRLRALLREGVQPAAGASTQDDGCSTADTTVSDCAFDTVNSHLTGASLSTSTGSSWRYLGQGVYAFPLETAQQKHAAPAMLLDTDRIELFICASRSMTAFTGSTAGDLQHQRHRAVQS